MLKLMHTFLKHKAFINPECTFAGDPAKAPANPPLPMPGMMLFYDRNNLVPDFEEFAKEVKKWDYQAISCAAATDKADTRRSVLTYYVCKNQMVVLPKTANPEHNAKSTTYCLS